MPARDQRSSRAWRTLAARVVTEEPVCWLHLPGCTRLSTTADHVLTVRDHPELVMERQNLRGACRHCNSSRKARTADEVKQPGAEALRFFDC